MCRRSCNILSPTCSLPWAIPKAPKKLRLLLERQSLRQVVETFKVLQPWQHVQVFLRPFAG